MAGDFEYQWGQLVARAWDDPAFKARLLADPAAVLEEYGLERAGKRFQVVEDTDEVVHLVLPGRPGPQELSEEELRPVGAGTGGENCFRCGEECHRCGESCHRCSEGCYRCERC